MVKIDIKRQQTRVVIAIVCFLIIGTAFFFFKTQQEKTTGGEERNGYTVISADKIKDYISSSEEAAIQDISRPGTQGGGGTSESGGGASFPAAWKPYEKNPLISGHPFKFTAWGDPWVIKSGSYIMYLTRGVEMPQREGKYKNEAVAPFMMVSSNGIEWFLLDAPLIYPGSDKEDFDYYKVETVSVVKFKGKFHMYYTGISYDEKLSIGHAVSSGGLDWTKAGPVISDKDYPSTIIGEPGALVLNDKIYLYYSITEPRLDADKASAPAKITLYLSTSEDGFKFSEPVKVLEQNKALYPPSEGYEGYSTPAPAFYNGKIHLFYDIYKYEKGRHEQVAIQHAVSADGASSWTEDNEPIITRDSFTWSSRQVFSPTVVAEDKEIKMWFSGWNMNPDKNYEGIMGIGLLTQERDRVVK